MQNPLRFVLTDRIVVIIPQKNIFLPLREFVIEQSPSSPLLDSTELFTGRLSRKKQVPEKGQTNEAVVFRLIFRVLFLLGFKTGLLVIAAVVAALWANSVLSAPYASMVMDARNGKVIYSRNAETKLHPASLTKMMTLYIAFEAVENGEISLDTKVRVSKSAAAEPASKLYLKAGSRIKLRYLIRAAAVRSANDAATAIAEAIGGSEKAFVARMNRTARALGMTKTSFRNAHGLSQDGHRSTARDMTILGRHMIYDFPEYYNLFSRRSADAGLKTVSNTNRRFLNSYRGSDGIKTGYTRAAGFNLVASAERGGKRIIATVFGGRSVATRNNHVAELLDKGFKNAPARVAVRATSRPRYAYGEIVRVKTTLDQLIRPKRRPKILLSENEEFVGSDETTAASSKILGDEPMIEGAGDAVEFPKETVDFPLIRPKKRPVDEIARLTPSDSTNAGIHLGSFRTREAAEKHLLKTALMDFRSLITAVKAVQKTDGGYVAKFGGLSESNAEKACVRLKARKLECSVFFTQ